MQGIFIIILITILSSCNNSDNSIYIKAVVTKNAEEADTSATKDTFSIKELSVNNDNKQSSAADIRLSFTKSTPIKGGVAYKVNSLYKSKIVGFELIVTGAGYSKLTMKSTGINSNNFLAVLSKLYKQKVDTSLHFTDSITADCVNIGDYIDSLNKRADGSYINTKAQYKLFFKGKNEDDYAELFLNINKKEHWIEFEEKDEIYRPVLINLWASK